MAIRGAARFAAREYRPGVAPAIPYPGGELDNGGETLTVTNVASTAVVPFDTPRSSDIGPIQ